MIRINLLPYRVERRRQRKIQFGIMCGVVLLIGLIVVGIGHLYNQSQIEYQEARNNFLKEKTAELERQIKELEKLQKETDVLLARKTVVEDLQSTRTGSVHLLDQVLKILPEEIYLKSLVQQGNVITVMGIAQTNARVSTLMRAIEGSPWLDKPTLVEISAAGTDKNGVRQSTFTMKFNLVKGKKSAPVEGGEQ